MPVGDKEATDAAFRDADVTIKQWMVNHRLVPNAMEPRGVVAHYDPGQETLTVWSSTQVPHLLKSLLSGLVRMPEHKIRVIAPEVGGGFGCKIDVYAEDILCCAGQHPPRQAGEVDRGRARRTSMATIHGRDIHAEIELAARSDGTLLGQRMQLIADIGAYQQLLTAAIPTLTSLMLPGLYKVPALYAEVTEVYTNKTPTDAYRGAGRPEATYFIERGMDMLAQKLNLDPAELRRRNFIETGRLPLRDGRRPDLRQRRLRAGAGPGAGEGRLRRPAPPAGRSCASRAATWASACRPTSRSAASGPSAMRARRRLGGRHASASSARGKVTVLTGTSPHGQGGETAFAQMVAEELGVPIDDVTVLHGDTGTVPFGIGTFGSRAIAVGGTALIMSVDKVKDKAKKFAGHMLEALPDDIVYDARARSTSKATRTRA